ncbi:hypothetical protein L228DRAFT_243923 [Xylona heveae TC161]|uniref:Pyruvate dehydrogenase protein x component n=1 Tax=Xylona heveae (strain CBS 132557 / TC161) TaxID=1328760 RepID=A0A165IMZ8_XYLHT|nr:hypothetical protein L228DRAFT_243923 [Xylona heveae TC161]KZF25131.1 hypothetical protein L228DRAFT_243923 [Xylona heveae TC161]
MASLSAACRLSARLVGGQLRQPMASRTYRTSAAAFAAQNFAMPAMSPTMTEGNISSWKVKEGESFAAGDVILEIETDKATMDVEAADDGILAKIMQGDGTKGIQVGERIAVLAEPGDDLSQLSLPADDAAPSTPTPQEETAAGIDPSKSSGSQAEAPPTSKPSSEASAGGPPKTSGKPANKKYPFYPSVEFLLHQNGLSKSEAEKIPATGPNGRLLKGDVLAYLGRIQPNYASDLSARISKLSHLDLSNIKAAPPKAREEPTPAKAEEVVAAPAPEPDSEVTISISLTAVVEVQRRVQETLGVFLPLSTFIARASEVANEALPRSKTVKPSADELFNQVLGLDKIGKSYASRGSFTPQIIALPSTVSLRPKATPKADIFDILSGKPSRKPTKVSKASIIADEPPTTNVFFVTTPKGDEKRAEVFLKRVKALLEAEPGRLVV